MATCGHHGFMGSWRQIYVDAIRRMTKHYRHDPATYTVEEVQAYLLHLISRQFRPPQQLDPLDLMAALRLL
jgi:hypothetical protein